MNVTDPVEEENYFLRRAITEEGRWPVPIMPISPDRRMVAQQGLFTVDRTLEGIEAPTVTTGLIHTDEDPGGKFKVHTLPLFQRIDLRRDWRRDVLDSLRLMNITEDTLFPGLDGLGGDVALLAGAELRLSVGDALDSRMSPRHEDHSG